MIHAHARALDTFPTDAERASFVVHDLAWPAGATFLLAHIALAPWLLTPDPNRALRHAVTFSAVVAAVGAATAFGTWLWLFLRSASIGRTLIEPWPNPRHGALVPRAPRHPPSPVPASPTPARPACRGAPRNPPRRLLSPSAMWETLRASAPYSWLILVASALGSLASLSAILALHRRPRTALWLGAAATLLTLACATAGAAGAWQLRLDADASATDGELRPAQRLRIRRSGYQLAQLPPRLALFPGALPFLTGAALMFAAARRRGALLAPPPDPDLPFSPRPKLGVPVVFTLAGAISAAVQVGALLDRVPGGHPGAAGTAQRFAADIARLDKAFEHDDILAACERLEDDLDARAASLDPTLVPALPGATRRCVEELIQHALLSQSLHRIGRELEELQRSALVQGDPSLRKLVQSTAAEVEKIPPASDLATD